MPRYKEFWYNSWRSMMARCYNEKSANYKYYGGVGVTVCAEWHNANNFAEWAKSSCWFEGATLDRIDNSKGYSPDNCKWSTKKEQAKNRRTTRFITNNGETHNITEWAEILGVDRTLLNKYGFENCGNYISDDVAPRAEVAREIFEEIEKLMNSLDGRYMASGNPKQSWGIRGAMAEIAELKKKYTESED